MATIVIFGAAILPGGKPSTTLRRRVEAAIACARNDPAARFVPSGAVGRHGPSEASVMAALLRKSGVPDDRILLEETGRDTWSSVRAVHRLVCQHGLDLPIRVATSAYHMPRCLTLLCLCGIPAQPCTPPSEPAAASHWKRWYWRLREVPALPYDAMLAVWARLTGTL